MFPSLVATMVVGPTVSALGTVGCTYDAGTVAVVLEGGDAVALAVDGGAITVNGSPCSSATTTNTDLITVRQTSAGDGDVTINLTGGPFAPGLVDEPGGSDEIEIEIDLGGGTRDAVTIAGTAADDRYVAGDAGINLNASETDGVDADVTLSGVPGVTLDGAAANDLLGAGGGSGTGGPATSAFTMIGGAGSDRLVSGAGADHLTGGAGSDIADYSSRTQAVAVTVGSGDADDGGSGEADEVASDIEQVVGGSGGDHLMGDGNAERLLGGPGDDRLFGSGGDDELRGDDGADLLEGGANDDFLNGGPGNDEERGGGFNDVFSPNRQDHFGSFASVPIADGGVTTTSLAVSGAQTTIYDTNVRLDIEHPATQQLKVTLIGPSGSRNVLIDRRGNGTPLQGTHFDSEALVNIRNAGNRPFEGRFHPDGSMEIFDSQDPNGTWTLEIVDAVAGGTGTLNFWDLQLTLANPTSDGDDVMRGGIGNRDLVEYFGRTQPVVVTLAGGADDGQSGERDDVGGSTADVEDLYGGAAGDIITGTDANNEIRGMIGNDHVFALAGADTIRGRQGADVIDGGNGNDTLNGGTGDDQVDGGAGKDFLNYTGAPAAVTVDLSTGASSGGDGADAFVNVETVTATTFSDTLIGDDQITVLDGAAGNDIIEGRGGNDSIEGRGGADQIDGGEGWDWIRYQRATQGVTVDLTGGTASGEGFDSLVRIEYIIGSRFADDLTGNERGNNMKAGAGDDRMAGLAGPDKLHGQDGTDEAHGGDGSDVCTGSETTSGCES